MRWAGAAGSAVGFATIGILVVRLWLDPLAWGDERWVRYMPMLLMTEFALLAITLVAAGLCSRTPKLAYRALIAAAFLVLFFAPTIYVARMLGDDPLVDYLLVLIGARFLALAGSSAAGYEELIGRTAVAAAILILVLLAMLLVTAIVPMPLGGIDAALLERIIPSDAETGWEREPQRTLATVVVYCLAMVCVELLLIGPGAGKRRR
ncbi:MAG: hypothetical protein AB7O31_14725 [Burkholderiales bacterium]